MDILGADDMKWTMRIIAHYAMKKLESEMKKQYNVQVPKDKSFIDYVHDDLGVCTNPGIRKIYKQLLLAGQHMPTQHHSSMIVDLGSFLLWVVYKDTAYRDPLFWIINNIMEDPEFKDNIKDYVTQPMDWYCPRWIQSKESTEKLRNEGIIPEYDMSPDEKRFVPAEQFKEINKMVNEQIERNKLRNK